MPFWFLPLKFSRVRRPSTRATPTRLTLEPLEDRCVPSASGMQAMSTPPAATLSHTQVHLQLDQHQLQATIATVGLDVDKVVLTTLQHVAVQTPQIKQAIAKLTSDISADQAALPTLQHQISLLSQLDSSQDQSRNLSAMIRIDTSVAPLLQHLGAQQTAHNLESTITKDQMAVQALQPQVAAFEQEVSAFVR